MLEVYRNNDSLSFSPLIGITDIRAGRTATVETLRSELKEQKEILERNRQEQVALRNASLSTLDGIRAQMKEWKAVKNGNSTYAISGPGLGWLDGKLASGQWVFRADTGKMIPQGKEGIDLVGILIVQ